MPGREGIAHDVMFAKTILRIAPTNGLPQIINQIPYLGRMRSPKLHGLSSKCFSEAQATSQVRDYGVS